MPDDETYVSKLQVKNSQVYVKLTWKQNDSELFHIQVFDGDCSWSGRFSNDFAQQFRERHDIDEEEDKYANNVKRALLGEDENYAYDLTKSSGDVETASFSWKRRFKGINVLHGKVPVHLDLNTESKNTLVDILLQKNAALKKDVDRLESKTDELTCELDKSKNELEKFANMKSSLETTLYGRFVQLLNAKKRRIQLLEDNLLNFEEPTNVSMTSELD